MLTSLFFTFFVGIWQLALATAEYGWRPGSQYSYSVRGRTVTGLNQVTNQFTGVLIQAKLNIQVKSASTLSLQIEEARYAEIHRNLSNGWDTSIPEESLNYVNLSLKNRPYELYLDDGIIKEMTVDQSVPTWELNILKSIVSLLQVDIRPKNVINSRRSQISNPGLSLSVYKTMEDSVNGVTETIYDISEVEEYMLLNQPELLPLPHLVGKGSVYEIVKTRNFSNSDQHMVYCSGLDDQKKWKPGSNQMGNFLTRSSASRIILSGSLKEYVIQSSMTTDKIMVAPHLYNKEKGMVGSRIILSLESIASIKLPFPVVHNPRPIRNLVYEYNKKSHHSKRNGMENPEISLDYGLDDSLGLPPSQKRLQLKFPYSSSSQSKESEILNTERLNLLSKASPLNYITFTDESKCNILNSTENIIKLSLNIGHGIISPNILTGDHILNKFSLLVRLIRTISTDQLREVTEILHYPYTKAKKSINLETARKYHAWISFRDAVGQSGTGPALMAIREWLKSKKIDGEEASHLIMSLSETAKHPTTDYINYFFDMLNDEMMKNDGSLRTCAVLSFTDLVRKALIEQRTSQSNYPVYMFKSFKMNNNSAIVEKYVTYFKNLLNESVERKDSINIQLYIRALNNIGHPNVLKVFKPFLEGNTIISKFQRFAMISSMDNIVKLYPDLAQSVLFRIYNNMADTPEVRIAAVIQFMKTNPSAVRLQSMAQQTNFDQNKQVNAAVKSAIESIAKQEINKYNKDMVEKARSAVNLLTPENYGLQYSRNFINSFIVKGRNLAYKHHMAYVQSTDSLYPSSVFYNLKNNLGGFKRISNEITFLTSSANELIDHLYDQLFYHSSKKENIVNSNSSKNKYWTLNNIYNSLKFEKEENEQVEGYILTRMLGVKRFLPFDKNTLQNINLDKLVTNILDNNGLNFTKLYNQYNVEIVFPTCMGFPFIYTLETPTVVNVGLTASRDVKSLGSRTSDFSVVGSFNVLYSTNKEGKLGFVTPYNGKTFSVSLERNIHFNIPIKMGTSLSLESSTFSITFEPIEKRERQKLLEFSTRAFTSMRDSNNINSFISRKDSKLVHKEPIKLIQKTIGHEKYGFSFDVNMASDTKNLGLNNIFDHLKGHDMVSLVSFVDLLDEINNTNYSIIFDPQNSWSKNMELSFSYDKTASKEKPVSSRSHLKTNNSKTQNDANTESKDSYEKEILKNVGINIKNAQTNLIKLKIGFRGLYQTEYEIIFASSNSHTSNTTRILGLMKNSTTTHMKPKTYLSALEITSIMSTVPLWILTNGVSSGTIPPSSVKGRLIFGEEPPYKNHIVLEGDLYASQKRLKYLQKHPLTILCKQQIQMGYKIQSACRNVTRRLNYLDKYQLRINYEHIPNDFKNMVYEVYRYINYLWYDYSTETADFREKDGNINVEVMFGKNLLSSNLSIVTPEFTDKYENVPVHEWIRPLVVLHPQHGMLERLGQKIMIAQQSPTCTYDKDQITTFDNVTYYVNLGDKFHILTQYIPKDYNFEDNKNEYFSIIIGQHSLHLTNLRIIVGEDVLEVIPGSGGHSALNFFYNGKQIFISNDIKELHDPLGNVILKLFSLSGGAVKFVAERHGFEIVHDGNHITLLISNKYRNKLRGLCGNFDGESYNDFITPQNCIASNSGQFIASYGFLNSKINEINTILTDSECYREKHLFGKIINENEVNKYIEKKKKMNEDTLKNKLLREMLEASIATFP